MWPPGIKSRRLGNLKVLQHSVIGHRPPAERQILRDQIRQRIEAIVFAAKDPCRDVVACALLKLPAAIRQDPGHIYVRLQRLERRELAIRGMDGAQLRLPPAMP